MARIENGENYCSRRTPTKARGVPQNDADSIWRLEALVVELLIKNESLRRQLQREALADAEQADRRTLLTQ